MKRRKAIKYGIQSAAMTLMPNLIPQTSQAQLSQKILKKSKDGKIVVVGSTNALNGSYDFLVLRFLINGSQDSSFNSDGVFRFNLANDNEEASAIALQPDGKILVGGMGKTTGEDDFILRLDSTGNLDSSFNTIGFLTKDHNNFDNYITNILLQADGKFITVGQLSDTIAENVTLSRYLSSGTDDIAFGNNGTIVHSIAYNSYCNSAILQSDNRILITGNVEQINHANIYTARFENDSLFSSIDDLTINKNTIYPVPATDKIYFKENLDNYVTVFDSRGQIVIYTVPANNSVDVSALSPGIYLLRMETGTEQFAQKFIKQ